MKDSVSIILPAFNEEKNVASAIDNAVKAVKDLIDYEIIAIDDGSSDKTVEIIDNLAKKNKFIRVVHHKKNMGFGYSIKEGIKVARGNFITGFPGDNDTSANLLRSLIKERDHADLIIAYMANPWARSYFRRFLSFAFVFLMNLIFHLNLKYYNSYFISKAQLLKNLKLVTEGFSIFAEAKVRLIKNDVTYKEIPFEHIARKYGKSKVISFASFANTLAMMGILARDVYFR